MLNLMKQYETKNFSSLILKINPSEDPETMPNVTSIEEAKVYIENLYPDTTALIDIAVDKVFLMSKSTGEIVKTF